MFCNGNSFTVSERIVATFPPVIRMPVRQPAGAVMSVGYLYRLGTNRRVIHLARCNRVTGELLMYPACGMPGDYATTINVTSSAPVCKRCRRSTSFTRQAAYGGTSFSSSI